MKKYYLLVLASLFFSLHGFGQNAQPTPTPQDGDIVKISTNLIQVDVTVTDKKSNAIRDLKPEEVEIYENGKLQKISNFSFVSGTKEELAGNANKVEKKTPDSTAYLPSPTRVRPEQVRRTIALVVDDLTLSLGSTVWVKEALKKFVNEQMQEGDLVAIIRTGAGVGALQQFTTDKRQLFAAIDRVKFNMAGEARLSFFSPVNTSTTQKVVTAQSTGTTAAPPASPELPVFDIGGVKSNDELEADFSQFRENIFATGTLGALNFIVKGMNQLPGRKSVVLLSDGMKLVTRDDNGRPETSRIYTSLKHLIDIANRASVLFYTIHAAGLVVPMIDAEEDVSGIARTGGERLTSNIVRDRINQLSDSQEGLRYLANETGGFAYVNQNDISYGIRKVLEDQSYYLVGYQPDDETFNAKQNRYNKFEVKVKREGARVRYRSGFFGISEEQITRPNLTVTDSMLGALTSPFAVNDVTVRMNALFASEGKQGSFVRTFLNVNAGDLTFVNQPDGKHKTVFDIVAITFGDNGNVLDERSKTLTVTLDEKEYQRFLARGFVSTFSLPVKKPGGYQVRLAIRDTASSKVGSANQYVEIPDLKKNKLTLSGMVLKNVPFDIWPRVRDASDDQFSDVSDAQWDTSVRQFKSGSVLRFGYDIYNSKSQEASKSGLTYHYRLFTNGKLVFDGTPAPISKYTYTSPQVISTIGAIRLGEDLLPGDYVLRVDVTDHAGKDKSAIQFIQFEIVN